MAPLPVDEAALSALLTEWNKAEKAIKLAEQVNGEIVNPAVYELRYAGRRIVEALASTDPDKVRELIADAQFDCCRARHDAIDAATSKIAADLDIAVKRLGAGNVLKHFAEFPVLFQNLSDVRERIAVSRENRNDRDAIYAAIENDNLNELVRAYKRFQGSEKLLRRQAKRERWGKVLTAVIAAIGVIGSAYTIYGYYNPPPPAATAQATVKPPTQ